MGRLRDYDVDFIRAIARVRFTDLVGECSRHWFRDCLLACPSSGACRDDSTISQYVYVPAISRAPFQLHLMFGSLRLQARLEHNVTPARVNRGKDIDPAPSVDVVWRARSAALGWRDKMSRVIQGRPTRIDLVLQLGMGRPEQGHCAGDMRSRHGRAAGKGIGGIGRVTGRASVCARSSDIRFYPVAAIDSDRTAAAKGSDRYRCRYSGRRPCKMPS